MEKPVEATSSLMNYERAPFLIAQTMHEMGRRNIYAIIAIVHLIVCLAIHWPIAAAVGTIFFIGCSIYHHRRLKECKTELVWSPVNRIVCFFKHGFPSTVDLFQDTVRVGRPTIRGWVKVMMIKEAENVCYQGADTAKTARANHLAGNLPKEAFDQVEPG